jgi:hypothetical protein
VTGYSTLASRLKAIFTAFNVSLSLPTRGSNACGTEPLDQKIAQPRDVALNVCLDKVSKKPRPSSVKMRDRCSWTMEM